MFQSQDELVSCPLSPLALMCSGPQVLRDKSGQLWLQRWQGGRAGNLIPDVTLLLKAGSANAVAMLQSTSQGVLFSRSNPTSQAHWKAPHTDTRSWSLSNETKHI